MSMTNKEKNTNVIEFFNHHKPVLIDDIITFINKVSDCDNRCIFFDGTFGGGGYTRQLLNLGRVFSCDSDQNAVDRGVEMFSEELKCRSLELKNKRFDNYIKEFEDEYFDFVVADLGFSSNQLSQSDRGFSYKNLSQSLDLRYDSESGRPCWKLLYGVKTVDNLRKVIYTYSGEEYSKRIAQTLFDLIKSKEFGAELTVGEVVNAVKSAIPDRHKKHSNAILSRVWQALRIWTNDEFEVLNEFLNTSIHKVKHNGYIMIVCFHSLEDKIVTKFMRSAARPIEMDDFGNKEQFYDIITKKPIVPSTTEIEQNVRSRSATLRILKKI